MANEKQHLKATILVEYGILFQPVVDLIQSSELPSASDYRMAIAKMSSATGLSKWRGQLQEFCKFGDIFYETEFKKLARGQEFFRRQVLAQVENSSINSDLNLLKSKVSDIYNQYRDDFFTLLETIPTNWESETFLANTPFTSYLKIKDCFKTAKIRIDYFDRYINEDFFRLFINSISRNIEVRVITTPRSISSISSLSQLCYQEFTNYQLFEVHQSYLHDRNLRIDDSIFNLGPGVDRAGLSFTNFGFMGTAPASHQGLDNIISNGIAQHS